MMPSGMVVVVVCVSATIGLPAAQHKQMREAAQLDHL